ncbi:MAG: hypothetical protein INH43_03025 [Acidobacteriaceae bacterium]|nr:hypothetical protein [Acidobacteriaceae bacterium]
MSTWYVKNDAIMVRKHEREHLGENAPETVCEMISSLSLAETSRNARLIAAAPELLAALEIWARYAERNGWTDAEHHDGDPATTGWITRTRAAIARAKGRP